MKYKPEKKAEALSRIAQIGVPETSKELGISLQTLYKWRNESQGGAEIPSAQPEIDDQELRKILQNDQMLEAAVKRLETENASLRAENAELRQTAGQLKRALLAILK